jgi:F-type H+-transporting ATPase subunit gamma
MLPLIRLREDLRFSRDLLDMIEVLKSATARQFRLVQGRKKGFEAFKTRLEEFMVTLADPAMRHPFLAERRDLPKAVVIVTSDEGFLGALNVNVLTAGLDQAAPEDEIIVLGERGARYLTENYRGTFTVLAGLGDDITYDRAMGVRDLVIEKYLSGKVGTVLAVYPRFLSLTVQEPDVVKLLPCSDLFKEKAVARSTPGRALRVRRFRPMPVEPDRIQAVDFLVRASLMERFYDMFWDSKLAECAARILHLEGSHQEILGLNQSVLRDYMKHFHQRSDKDIREIFASRLKWREVSGAR